MSRSQTALFLYGFDSRGGFSSAPAPQPDHRVLAWQASINKLVLAQDPLEGINYLPDKTGWAVEFGRLYAEKHNCNVVLVPCYQRGSGFQNNDWKENGVLYDESVSRFNSAFTASSNPYFAGILGSIGTNNVGTTTFLNDLVDMIERFRSDLYGGSPKTPAVIMELQEDYITTYGRSGIQSLIEGIVDVLPYSAVVDNTGIRSNGDLGYSNQSNLDFAHDYDYNLIAARILDQLDNAIINHNPTGTYQGLPPIIHSQIQIEKQTSFFRGKVTFPPVFYNPLPISQVWSLIEADDQDLTNASIVESVSVPVNTHTVDFTSFGMPSPNGKYYFSRLQATNENGTSEFTTASNNAYYHI